MPTITMPQLGESVTEGTIGRWLKKPGDRVRRDEPLVEVITDKVNAEIPAPVAGVLERVTAGEGTIVAVGQEIAYLTTDADRLSSETSVAPATATAATPGAVTATGPATSDGDHGTDDGPRSSPLVRKLVREHHLDLHLIHGTGLGGRVTRDDVEAYLRAQPGAGELAAPASPAVASATGPAAETPSLPPPVEAATFTSGPTDQRLIPSPMRRTIAQRMSRSVREIPHAWLTIEVDVTRLVRLRDEIKERFRQTEGVDLTYIPFFMKAAVESLREFPIINSSWSDDQIVLKREINLGVAVALDGGLVVPVLRNADQKSVVGLAHDLADVVGRARAGKLTVADVDGGTFTVNNTGAFGSIASQPIINYPQAAIMNMEAIVKRAVVVDDAIAIRSMMNLCLSFDHRVLDGALAGRFLQSVRRHLESWGPGSAL